MTTDYFKGPKKQVILFLNKNFLRKCIFRTQFSRSAEFARPLPRPPLQQQIKLWRCEDLTVPVVDHFCGATVTYYLDMSSLAGVLGRHFFLKSAICSRFPLIFALAAVKAARSTLSARFILNRQKRLQQAAKKKHQEKQEPAQQGTCQQNSLEYVILEDFNFTRGRLYPRQKQPQLDLYLGYLLKLLNVISWAILVKSPPPRPWQEFCDSRTFPCLFIF